MTAVVAVGVLAIGVGVLSVLALQSTASSESPESAGPAPTFDFGDRATTSPSASATPSPTSTSTTSTPERFLAVDGSDLWRATSGACGGAAPEVEYSTDGGESWAEVTPAAAVQVMSLATFGEGQAEAVAATDAACTPAALRTYTAGRAWESYPQMLAGATFVSPTDRSTVVVAGAAMTAPCADARSARTSRTATGIVCDGTAFLWADGEWMSLAAGAVALDAVAGTIVVAHVSDACRSGVTVTQFTGTSGDELGCVSDVDAASPAAISVLGDDLVFWSGDNVFGLD